MRYIKIYGLQRSGTNYLKALLEKNFEVRALQNIGGSKHQKITGITNPDEVDTDIDQEEIKWIDVNFNSIPKICIYKPYEDWLESYSRYKKLKGEDVEENVKERYNDYISHWKQYCYMIDYSKLVGNIDGYLSVIEEKYNLKRIIVEEYRDVYSYMPRGGDRHFSNYI